MSVKRKKEKGMEEKERKVTYKGPGHGRIPCTCSKEENGLPASERGRNTDFQSGLPVTIQRLLSRPLARTEDKGRCPVNTDLNCRAAVPGATIPVL